MRRAIPRAVLVLLPLFLVLSCAGGGVDRSHDLTIINNSSRSIERVGITYTGISRAPLPDFDIAVAVPSGGTNTVELILDPSSDYYTLFIWNDTDSKRIIWDGLNPAYEYVLLSKGGTSICTVEDSAPVTIAGENNVTPYSFDW